MRPTTRSQDDPRYQPATLALAAARPAVAGEGVVAMLIHIRVTVLTEPDNEEIRAGTLGRRIERGLTARMEAVA